MGGGASYGIALPKIDIMKVSEIRSKSIMRGGVGGGVRQGLGAIVQPSAVGKHDRTPSTLLPSTNRNFLARDNSVTPINLNISTIDPSQLDTSMTRDNSTIL